MFRAGFSLLELMFVMLFVSIVSSLGLSSWRQFTQQQQLISSTQSIVAYLNGVKHAAFIYNHDISVIFHRIDNGSFCLYRADDNGSLSTTLCEININDVELSVDNESSLIRFYGRRNNAKATTLIIKNNHYEHRIIISSLGRIRSCGLNLSSSGIPLC